VDAILTGLHEPRSTHLAMLETLVERESSAPASKHPPVTPGREHLEIAYAEALREGYLWHEFGDLHLILP
jgi:S-adenosylmethionine:tRNA ribosyltransferase-isomerase